MVRPRPLNRWTLSSSIQIPEPLFEFKVIILPEFKAQTGKACGHFKKKAGEEERKRSGRGASKTENLQDMGINHSSNIIRELQYIQKYNKSCFLV